LTNMERKKRKLQLPGYIEEICEKLENAGFAAYTVGGCVRDLLRGEIPHDYDVTTAALPSLTKRLFPKTVDTGLTHGTVTVIMPEGIAEVTTFRRDGAYVDKRRPESVTFVSSVEDDLSRRDFTVNAIAYSPIRGLCDPFSGQEDLKAGILRTVGNPMKRFAEDALRILRLYRFAAQLHFSIDEETANAALRLSERLTHVSRERIYAETAKLIAYGDIVSLSAAASVLSQLVDADFSAENLKKVEKCASAAGKWAILCRDKTEEVLRSLRAPNVLLRSATELAAYKEGEHIAVDVAALRHTTPEDFFAFLDNPKALFAWEETKASGAPMDITSLAISGSQIEKIGFRGKEIGDVLQKLFMYAIQNPVNNNEESLKEVARWMYRQKESQKA